MRRELPPFVSIACALSLAGLVAAGCSSSDSGSSGAGGAAGGGSDSGASDTGAAGSGGGTGWLCGVAGTTCNCSDQPDPGWHESSCPPSPCCVRWQSNTSVRCDCKDFTGTSCDQYIAGWSLQHGVQVAACP